MPKLSIGVIGTGSIGDVHLTGYAAQNKNVIIKALCDITPARLDEMGEKYGVPKENRYRDWKKMLASEKLDGVSISLPNYLHYEAARDAITAGCNVLLEKPMVLNMEQARALKKVAEKHSAKVMVAFSHRFFHTNIAAKKMLDKGAIGDPFMIRVRFAHGGPYPGWAQSDWFYKKALAGGGAILDMGIHGIDICQYFIGPVASISADIKTLRKKIAVDDNAIMLLDFAPKKCLGYVECGWTSSPGFQGIEIYGDKGTILLELGKSGQLIKGINRPDSTLETVIEVIPLPEGAMHWPLQIESWVKTLMGKKTVTPVPGIAEGASSLAVALAATESSKTGKRVRIKR